MVRCWCCWETSFTKENPLIRVCRNCKDIDLQYIHQDCINKYISCLPHINSFINYSIKTNTNLGLIENDSLKCTRCLDPYTIKPKKISPFVTFINDQFLFYSMILMTFCILFLTACCSLLLYQAYTSDKPLYLNLSWGLHINISYFATSMLLFCHLINYFSWKLVLDFCKDRYHVHVLPISNK